MITLSQIIDALGKTASIESCTKAMHDAEQMERDFVSEIQQIYQRLDGNDRPDSLDLVNQLRERMTSLQEQIPKARQAHQYASRRRIELRQKSAKKDANAALDRMSPLMRKCEKLAADFDHALAELDACDQEFVRARNAAGGLGTGLPPVKNMPAMPVVMFERMRRILLEFYRRKNEPIKYNENAESNWTAAKSHGLNWQTVMDERRNPKKEKMPPKPKKAGYLDEHLQRPRHG